MSDIVAIPDPLPILELRRYRLRPGRRETLIELFDRELIESQEELGMRLLGQFRDLDDPDSFVWLRGFTDMESRLRGLEAFYTGPAWRAHAQAANATMIDVDNVLLLRPVRGLRLHDAIRPAVGATDPRPGLLVVTVYPLEPAAAADFPALFDSELRPGLAAAGVTVLGTYVTEHSPNTFPALPVRDGEDVFVWMSRYVDEDDHRARQSALDATPAWADRCAAATRDAFNGRPEVLRLRPTSRSLLPA